VSRLNTKGLAKADPTAGNKKKPLQDDRGGYLVSSWDDVFNDAPPDPDTIRQTVVSTFVGVSAFCGIAAFFGAMAYVADVPPWIGILGLLLCIALLIGAAMSQPPRGLVLLCVCTAVAGASATVLFVPFLHSKGSGRVPGEYSIYGNIVVVLALLIAAIVLLAFAAYAARSAQRFPRWWAWFFAVIAHFVLKVLLGPNVSLVAFIFALVLVTIVLMSLDGITTGEVKGDRNALFLVLMRIGGQDIRGALWVKPWSQRTPPTGRARPAAG
jgi:hypothetical protein